MEPLAVIYGTQARRASDTLASEEIVRSQLRSDHRDVGDSGSSEKVGHIGIYGRFCLQQEWPVRPVKEAASACTAGQAALYKQAVNALTSILAHAEAIKRHALNPDPSSEDVAFSSARIVAEAKRAWAAMIDLEPVDLSRTLLDGTRS